MPLAFALNTARFLSQRHAVMRHVMTETRLPRPRTEMSMRGGPVFLMVNWRPSTAYQDSSFAGRLDEGAARIPAAAPLFNTAI